MGAIKTRANLSSSQYQKMLEMLKTLTPSERQSLNDPNFITEDEADIIVCARRDKEDGPSIPLEEIMREFGVPPRRRRA